MVIIFFYIYVFIDLKVKGRSKGITDHHLLSSTDDYKPFMEQNGLIDENKFLAFLAFILYHPKGVCQTEIS